jgi:hypothetical protein
MRSVYDEVVFAHNWNANPNCHAFDCIREGLPYEILCDLKAMIDHGTGFADEGANLPAAGTEALAEWYRLELRKSLLEGTGHARN